MNIELNREREWKPGDWFLIEYGYEMRSFYVLGIVDKEVVATRPGWCQSSYNLFNTGEMQKARYMGTGSRNWLFGWLDVCKRYNKPKGMGWL